MKPLIGVIARPDELKSGNKVMCVYDEIRQSIISSGGIPVCLISITNSFDDFDENMYKLIDMCDGIILQGGDYFNNFDIKCLEYICKKDIPVLGICLGMQLMGSIGNGNLVEIKKHCYKDKNYAHKVYLDKTSKLYSILKSDVISVNSRHKEILERTSFDIVGLSEDNVIEAIEDKTKKFFIGVQWHPETMYSYDILERQLFDYFINTCRGD